MLKKALARLADRLAELIDKMLEPDFEPER